MCSGRTRLALALLLGGGCSQLFGLDSPERIPDAEDVELDGDGDGFADSVDNCPGHPNPDQADVDGDTVGDVCQGCITLPLRAVDDDDGDDLADTIDNCIGHASVQADNDGDGIGDACDARNGKDTRFCVWTFRPTVAGEDAAVWTSQWSLGASFQIQDSQIKHQSSAMVDVATLREATFEAAGGVAFDTRVHLKNYSTPMVLGVAFELQTAVSNLYTCQVVQASSGSAEIQLVRDGIVLDTYAVPVTVPSEVSSYVRLSAIRLANGVVRVSCMMDIDGLGVGNLDTDIPDQPVKLRPRLLADRATVDFDHVTVYKLGI